MLHIFGAHFFGEDGEVDLTLGLELGVERLMKETRQFLDCHQPGGSIRLAFLKVEPLKIAQLGRWNSTAIS